MKLGISTYTYNWSIGIPGYPSPLHPMGARELLLRAQALGVALVQICDGIPLHMLPDSELDAIAQQADSAGIELEVGTSGIHPDHLRSYLRVANRLRAKCLRVLLHCGNSRPDAAESVAWLREVIPAFERDHVIIGIENHDKQKCEELIRIVEGVGSANLGICLDTANSYGTQETTAQVLDLLLPYAVNLHFKNFQIERLPHAMGFTVTGAPLDRGEVDFTNVLARIKSARKDINVILELWTPYAGSIAASVALEEKWAAEGVETLLRKMKI